MGDVPAATEAIANVKSHGITSLYTPERRCLSYWSKMRGATSQQDFDKWSTCFQACAYVAALDGVVKDDEGALFLDASENQTTSHSMNSFRI